MSWYDDPDSEEESEDYEEESFESDWEDIERADYEDVAEREREEADYGAELVRTEAELGDDLLHHFDNWEDAVEYVRGAPDGVLYIMVDEDDGTFDVYRDDNYGESAA